MIAFSILFITSLVGLALTLLTLPGVWLILLVALICQFAFGEPLLYSWWTLGIAFALALLGEIAEFAASAVGSTGAGGGFSGAVGSIVGSTVGAIVGTFALPIPIVGTIAGGVLGAGIGAIAAERGFGRRTWGDSCRIGRGAAIGRLIATVVKLAVAVVVALMLTIAVFL